MVCIFVNTIFGGGWGWENSCLTLKFEATGSSKTLVTTYKTLHDVTTQKTTVLIIIAV